MRRLALLLILFPLADAAAKDRGGDIEACTKGQAELSRKAADFHGEAKIKRLIEADMTRAKREEGEGDADECIEALDHANKLIAGEY
jgi:hypothetical protein